MVLCGVTWVGPAHPKWEGRLAQQQHSCDIEIGLNADGSRIEHADSPHVCSPGPDEVKSA